MWFLLLSLFFNDFRFSTMDAISNMHCGDMNPQQYVAMEQLLGTWYGVEIINHKENFHRHGIQYVDSCPIIRISEVPSATPSLLYKGNINIPRGNSYTSTSKQAGTHTQGAQYAQISQMGTTNSPEQKFDWDYYPGRYADEMRHMKLLWTDNGIEVEYDERYSPSHPGFWISSGPQNGSALDPQFDQFAGTVQVIKAFGNHLVLTFCLRLPDQQLYTIILSRIPKLARHEISEVYDLLTIRALEINSIKRVCSQSIIAHLNVFLLIVLLGTQLLRKCV